MIKHYLTIGLRNLWNSKVPSLINILGLAVGIACCLLIYLFVKDEFSFDKHHVNSDRLHRVILEQRDSDRGNSRTWASVSAGYAPKLKEAFPAIENSVRFWPWAFPVITYTDKKFVEPNFLFAEPSLLEMFSHPFLAGDPVAALTAPNSVVLTQSCAEKYFGQNDPMGKTISFYSRGDKAELQVTGIVEDVPVNSHFTFDMLGSFETWKGLSNEDFDFLRGNFNYPTYVLLNEEASLGELSALFPDFLENNMDAYNGMQPSERFKILLQPLADIHLNSSFTSDFAKTGSKSFLTIFIGIALLILLIACINFINLSTARATHRAREVGMRKVLGAQRTQVARQFIGESMVVAIAAMCVALLLVEIALPAFNTFTGKSLGLTFFGSGTVIPVALAVTAFVGLVAGSYPAFVLSGFRPLRVLGKYALPRSSNKLVRSGLVTFQFVISIGLLVGVLVMQKQLHFMNSMDLGFEKEQLLALRASSAMVEDFDLFKSQLRAQPGIVSMSAGSRVPSGVLGDSYNARVLKEGKEEIVGFRMPFVCVEENYFPTIETEMIAGRNFSKFIATDTVSSFVLNETAVQQLGWSPEEAVGKPFLYGRGKGTIIGVVQDFHFESMHHQIKPTVFFSGTYLNRILLRIQPQFLPEILPFLERIWKRYRPEYPFTYEFVDESFAANYADEQQSEALLRFFAGLAIFIACLGLFGLAVFMAEQRTREVAIRKTLGASVLSIVSLLSSRLVRLLIIANLLSWPIAYFLMRNWLDGFAYQAGIPWWTFLLSGLIAGVIAFLTIGFQSLKVALANPVDSLRND